VFAAVGINLWAWYHYREAGRSLDRCHFSEAYTHYTQALEVWRWSAALHFRAAQAARRATLYPEAEYHLAEYQRLQGDSAETTLPLALERLLIQAQSGDITAVDELLWHYIEKDKPETPLILEALARGYSRLFRLSATMNCLHKILEREPDNVEALTMTGKTIVKGGGEQQDAVKYFRRALELDPQRDDARVSLAQLLLRDRPEEARSHFEYVLARQPDNIDAMVGLGQALRMLSETDKARELLEAVLAKEPENSKALMELGYMAMLAGKMEEAETLLRKAIAANPANRDAHYRLYQCLSQQTGKEKEAAEQIAVYERVGSDMARLGTIVSKEMTSTPNDPKLHYEIGSFYLRYGKPDIGVRWLRSALKLDPDHQPSHQALYEYYQRTGDSEKAEQHRLQLR
jgi:tetratricopeptide (TPR) repeat protein